MKILVTGGAGFLGKHVVKYLLENKHQITIIDDFSNVSREDLEVLKKLNIKIIKGNITIKEDVDIATAEQEVVIHLAAKISVSESVKNPVETFNVNVEGTKNLLSSCKKNQVKKIIASSSAAVYGETKLPTIKVTEKSETNPISPYGESKLKMEKVIESFCIENKMKFVILRIFNMFGEGQSKEYAGVISKFLEKIKNNKQLDIFGEGLQTRDFISVDDVCIAIKNSIYYNENKIFNIATGNGISIKELSQKMLSISKKSLKINYLPSKMDDIQFSQADITLAKKEIDFNPKSQLEDLRKMMK